MEDYGYKVSNLHAILSYDYQQIGNIGKTTSRFTSESGSRRFLPREQQLFSGDASRCFRVWSSGIRAVDAAGSMLLSCWCQDFSWANLPLSRPLLSPLHYRFLPNFTDVYRSFGLSWETSAIKNDHSQDSRDSGNITRIVLREYYQSYSWPIFTDFSDFLGRLQPSKTTTHRTLCTTFSVLLHRLSWENSILDC